jgi:type VI secretion system protein VasD
VVTVRLRGMTELRVEQSISRQPAIRANLALGILLLAAGCSSPPPPPPPPTVVNVELSAATNSNLTIDGQGAPVDTRIYQLASKSGFDGAEFFPLYKTDSATLGPDLIKKDTFLLIPGGARSLSLTPTDAVHAVGVFAAYRDFQHVTWRASADIPPHQTTTLTITMDSAGVKLVAKSVKPASP